MDVSIAYQGGGARVVELMAAVKACRELEAERSDFRVVRVTGTSAGAIAAAMHATGCDVEAIVGQSPALKNLIELHFSSKKPSTRWIAWRLLMGRAVFDEQDLRQAIIDLFKLGNVDALATVAKLVKPPRQLRIVMSDIRTDSSEVADEGSHVPMVNALVDSCAIPFAFRVPGRATPNAHILDGGLFQNLPAREALRDLAKGQVALGISFEEDSKKEIDGLSLGGYAGAILGSLLSERIRDSAEFIKDSNVVRIKSRRSTFDFFDIVNDEFLKKFSEAVSYAKKAIESWIHNTQKLGGVDWSSDHPRDIREQQRETDKEILRFWEENGEYALQLELLHHEVVFQSGISGDLPDIYHLHMHLQGDRNEGLQFMRFQVYDLEGGPLKRTRVQVTDGTGSARNAMVLPIRPQEKKGPRSALVCLDRPLRAGDTLRVTKTEESFRGMVDYVQKGRNFEGLFLKPGKSAEELRITVHFPQEQQPRYVRDASPDFDEEHEALEQSEGIQLLTTSARTNTLRPGCVSWVSTVKPVVVSPELQFIKVVYDRGRARG
jgi:predicted acylesterase/phospholipase RssA